jgi:hypothetical protein
VVRVVTIRGICFGTLLSLSTQQATDLKDLIDQAGYWTMGPDSSSGEDGAQWILEIVSNGRYHVVERWTPGYKGRESPFRTLCLHILALSGFTPNSATIYWTT